MSVFNSVGTPLVVLMVILIVAGSIFGMSASGADIFNPAASAAEANRINVETDHQQAIFEQEQRLTEVQVNAEIEAIQREQEIAKQKAELALTYEQKVNEAKLAGYESFISLRNILIWALGIVASIGSLLAIGLTLGPKAILMLRAPILTTETAGIKNEVNNDPWKSKEFRKQMVKRARATEAAMRLTKTNQQHIAPFYDPSVVTKEGRNKLPLAG